jgi:hypothetical protein
MPDLYRVTLNDQMAEVDREIKLREKVYPHQVAAKKLSQERADWQLAVLREVAATLRLLDRC